MEITMVRSPNLNASLVRSGLYTKVASKRYQRISDGVEIFYHGNSFTWRTSSEPFLTWKSLYAVVAHVEDNETLTAISEA